jgi:hypothetical protein
MVKLFFWDSSRQIIAPASHLPPTSSALRPGSSLSIVTVSAGAKAEL